MNVGAYRVNYGSQTRNSGNVSMNVAMIRSYVDLGGGGELPVAKTMSGGLAVGA